MMARFRPPPREPQRFRKSDPARLPAKGGDKRLGVVQMAGGRRPAATADDVLDALDRLRVAVTLFDSGERLVYCNAHYNHLFPSLPPADSLLGQTYEELIRLELGGS